MIKSILITMLLFIPKIYGQNFNSTTDYKLNIPKVDFEKMNTIEGLQKKFFASLINLKNDSLKIREIELGEMEMYENSSVSIMTNPNLNNVKEIIRITIEYLSCCSNIEDYFLLINYQGELIELPTIYNSHCDGPEPYFEYKFPDIRSNTTGDISLIKVIPKNENFDSIIQKQYHWNGYKISEK